MENRQNNNKLLLFFLYLVPIIDIINGFMIRKNNISGIGSAFHLVLLVVLIVSAYLKVNINFGKYEKCTLILALCFIISSLFNSIILDNYQPISLDRVEKILGTAITITCLVCIQKRNYISHEKIKKIIEYICIVVSFVSLFANVTKLGNYTYEAAGLGMTGFFTGSNEPIAIFIILNVYLTYMFNKTKKNWYLLPFACNEINLIYAQSKSAYLSVALFAMIMIIIFVRMIFNKQKRNKNLTILLVPIFVTSVGLFGKKIFSSTIGKFITRQIFMKNAYSKTGFLNYIFSGRIGRIDKLLSPVLNREGIISFFQIMFGQGLNFNYYEILEIDVLDTYLYGGLFAALCVTLLMIFIIIGVWKATKSKFNVFLILIIYFFSFTAGHVWTGGICGTYFALVCTYIMFEDNK